MPSTDNPLVLLAYAASVVLGIPALNLVVKATVYITRATSKLELVAASQARLEKQFEEFRHDQRGESQSVELSLAILENDINVLQAKAGVPIRVFPDRRANAERRQS